MWLNMLLYHGTGADIGEFSLDLGGQTSGSQVARLGVSSALDPETAGEFASLAAARQGDNSQPNVMQLFHRAKDGRVLDLASFDRHPTNLELQTNILE